MDVQKDYSRRAFLKKFAMLSSASMLMGIGIGCSSPNGTAPVYGPVAVYGPQPVGSTTVTGIYFVDSQSTQALLQGSQAVPVHTQFMINFSADVNMASVADAITFVDSGNNAVACSKAWDTTNFQNRTINVIPASDLSHGTSYALGVGAGATDSNGSSISVTNDATADFKTIA